MKKKGVKKEAIPPPDALNGRAANFHIVAAGASAGGLEALKLLLTPFSPDVNAAIVIIQHLAPGYKSSLPELIQVHTKLTVKEISTGDRVVPGTVYIIPPRTNLSITQGQLHLEPSETTPGKIRPIDHFMQSLAARWKENSIAVILSGTGTDGTLGLKEIKAAGGMTLVQDPPSAKFSGMPQSAIETGCADFVLPPAEMAARIESYIATRETQVRELQTRRRDQFTRTLKNILSLVRYHTGYDFSQYKPNTIMRRVMKVIAMKQLKDENDYYHYLQTHPGEAEKLAGEFLIGVTSFFRDPQVFAYLERKVVPALLKKNIHNEEIRIWICGCSTGEEAYSFAMLFKEVMQKTAKNKRVLVFASDIDKEAITVARAGCYPENIDMDVPPRFLTAYFTKKNNKYYVRKEIMEMLVFAHHDMINDPPFSRIDLISCRNLLIYLNNDLQQKIIPLFHYSLNTGGILVLGTSENIGDYTDLFGALSRKDKVFVRKELTAGERPFINYAKQFDLDRRLLAPLRARGNTTKNRKPAGADTLRKSDNSCAIIVINKYNNVLYSIGDISAYLDPQKIGPGHSIMEAVRKEIELELITSLKRARHNGTGTDEVLLDPPYEKEGSQVRLSVGPLTGIDDRSGILMITLTRFEKTNQRKRNKKSRGPSDLKAVPSRPLADNRDHLEAAVGELELLNTELQTMREEFQSVNEELQSTVEELHTSKEELQSSNEELNTINAELQEKLEQHTQANDDLSNLLASIDVPTIFLDKDLRIKRFTPTAVKIFNFIPTDINRPLIDLSTHILYKNLDQDASAVLETLIARKLEAQTTDGTWYYIRILPYRTSQNSIQGVIITFVDITEQKKVEEQVRESGMHLDLVMENFFAVPYTCEWKPDIRLTFVGNSAYKIFGFMPEQFTSKPDFWMERVHREDLRHIKRSLADIKKRKRSEYTFRWKCSEGEYKHFVNYMWYVRSDKNRNEYLVGIWRQVPSSKK